jgi:hypothetical protein
MTTMEWALWAQAGFSLATFAAACVAVKIAYRAGKRTAELAEEVRQKATAQGDVRRTKLNVLETLLQHRATFEFPDAVNSLNMISVAFADDQEVRDAYASFLAAAEINERFHAGALRERYLAIIEKVVENLGMSETITVADIHQGFYPTFLDKQRALLTREFDDRFGAVPRMSDESSRPPDA